MIPSPGLLTVHLLTPAYVLFIFFNPLTDQLVWPVTDPPSPRAFLLAVSPSPSLAGLLTGLILYSLCLQPGELRAHLCSSGQSPKPLVHGLSPLSFHGRGYEVHFPLELSSPQARSVL